MLKILKGLFIFFNFSFIFCESLLFEAMEQELLRSLQKLQMEYQEKPYFISYRVIDRMSLNIKAVLGAIGDSDIRHNRWVYVEVRVGDYKNDNTIAGESTGIWGAIPRDGDVDAIRHSLWLLTDKAYKQALERFLKKQAKQAIEKETEILFDFSKDEVDISTPAIVNIDEKIFENIKETFGGEICSLSLIFKKYLKLIHSHVLFTKNTENIYFISSEGDKIYNNRTYCCIHANVVTQTKDGDVIKNFRFFYGEDENDLPEYDLLKMEMEKMAKEVENLCESEKVEKYNGPVIFEGESACVFFKNALSHYLLGDRQKSETGELVLERKLNKRIMPSYITVIDDPTINEFMGKKIFGGYEFDDEGVKSRKTILVENGVLKNFLTTRTPIESKKHSTGNARTTIFGTPGPSVSNFIVLSSKGLSSDKLKNKLIDICRQQKKDYGFIIRSIGKDEKPILVYKLDVKTGKEKLVRNVSAIPLSLSYLEKIVACGKDYYVYTKDLNGILVSYVSPAVLVLDIEINPETEVLKRPPILPSPLSQ